MKYEKPEMEIVVLERNVRTDLVKESGANEEGDGENLDWN